MKIDTIRLYDYHILLKHKLHIKKEILTDRQGIIIQLITDQGDNVYSEVSPFPHLHQETLAEARRYLIDMKSRLKGIKIPSSQALFSFFGKDEINQPSVRFGVESAILIALLQSGADVFSEPFSARHLSAVPVNALVSAAGEDNLQELETVLKAGYQAIKVKVGRGKPDQEIGFVHEVASLIQDRATLRLDANRSWELATAIDFCQALNDLPVEYIEEPLQNPRLLPLLYKKTGIPLALDESLSENTPLNFTTAEWISALVIKPTVLGSLRCTLDWLRLARQKGVKAVISDTFQSGVGLSFLIRLAAAAGQDLPMGFDTYQWLADDILEQRLTIANGSFIPEDVVVKAVHLNFSKLEEIIR